MTYSREVLLGAARVLHDESVGDRHCDRKYLDVCGVFVNFILKAPDYLRRQEQGDSGTVSDGGG